MLNHRIEKHYFRMKKKRHHHLLDIINPLPLQYHDHHHYNVDHRHHLHHLELPLGGNKIWYPDQQDLGLLVARSYHWLRNLYRNRQLYSMQR